MILIEWTQIFWEGENLEFESHIQNQNQNQNHGKQTWLMVSAIKIKI